MKRFIRRRNNMGLDVSLNRIYTKEEIYNIVGDDLSSLDEKEDAYFLPLDVVCANEVNKQLLDLYSECLVTFSPKRTYYHDVLMRFGGNLKGKVGDYVLDAHTSCDGVVSFEFVNKTDPSDIIKIENVSRGELKDLEVESEPVFGFFYRELKYLQRKGISNIKEFLTGKEYLDDPCIRLITTQEYLDILKKHCNDFEGENPELDNLNKLKKYEFVMLDW